MKEKSLKFRDVVWKPSIRLIKVVSFLAIILMILILASTYIFAAPVMDSVVNSNLLNCSFTESTTYGSGLAFNMTKNATLLYAFPNLSTTPRSAWLYNSTGDVIINVSMNATFPIANFTVYQINLTKGQTYFILFDNFVVGTYTRCRNNVNMGVNNFLNRTNLDYVATCHSNQAPKCTDYLGIDNWLYSMGGVVTDDNFTSPAVVDSIIFMSQSPSDITTSNAIEGVNITYNYTITNFINTSPYLNITVKNSSGSIINSYINGSILPAYTIVNYTNNTGTVYRFFLDDNIYPATYNYNNTLIRNQTHYNYTLGTANSMIKIQFINATVKKFHIIEVDIATSSSTTFTDAYYCNSSYVNGLPLAGGNCAFIGSFNFSTLYNHCHNNSCHNLFTMNTNNSLFNGVTLTETSYILVSGAGAGNVYVAYVNGSVRTNVSMSTSNRGLSWTNENFTVDAHMHFYNDNDYLEYSAYGYNSSQVFNSTPRTDAFNITQNPPSGVIINLSKENFFYSETGTATRTNSTPFNTNISYYKFVVMNSNISLYDTINASTNATGVNFSLINYSSGIYFIGVYAYDVNGQFSFSLSNSFNVTTQYISPCNTTITLNSTGVSVYFNYTSNNRSEFGRVIAQRGIINYSVANTSGYVTLYTLPNGVYSIYTRENIELLQSCTVTFCTNSWSRQTQPCVNSLRLINYTFSCPVPYDNPFNDTGLYEDCSIPSNTDKGLWIIILLFVFYLVLLITGLFFPFAYIGALVISCLLSWMMFTYFTDVQTIILLIFPVLTIIFAVFNLLLKKGNDYSY